MKEALLKLAEEVKAAADKVIDANRKHLEGKIDLEKSTADYLIELKSGPDKITESIMSAKADVKFAIDRKLELSQKIAARMAEAEYDLAVNKLSIEKILAQLPK